MASYQLFDLEYVKAHRILSYTVRKQLKIRVPTNDLLCFQEKTTEAKKARKEENGGGGDDEPHSEEEDLEGEGEGEEDDDEEVEGEDDEEIIGEGEDDDLEGEQRQHISLIGLYAISTAILLLGVAL